MGKLPIGSLQMNSPFHLRKMDLVCYNNHLASVDDQITIWSSWLSLPHLNDSLTLTSASSILQLFYPLSRQYIDSTFLFIW